MDIRNQLPNERKSQLIKLIEQNIINIRSCHIESLYHIWRNGGDSNGLYIQNKSVIPKSHKHEEVSNTSLFGIDLPYWFGDYEKANKKIMVLGIDPLRNKQAFKKAQRTNKNIDERNFVLLGTPYDLHSRQDSQKKAKGYHPLIDKLSQDNFIYLSDVYKTFFYYIENNKRKRSYNYYFNLKMEERFIFDEILKDEIEIIKPDVIITFGKIAFQQLTGKNIKLSEFNIQNQKYMFDEKILIIPMMHLSGAVRNEPFKNFLESNAIYVEKDATQDLEWRSKKYVKLIKNLLNLH